MFDLFNAPFHPKVVHFPIALSVLMPLIAGGLLLAWWRGWLPKRAWWVAVALQAILVISGFVAIDSGGDDEERVEKVVPESVIEAHSDAADIFVGGACAVLALAAAGALLKGRAGGGAALVAVVGTVVVLYLGYRTGEKGGAVAYAHGGASVWRADTGGAAPPVTPQHDDD